MYNKIFLGFLLSGLLAMSAQGCIKNASILDHRIILFGEQHITIGGSKELEEAKNLQLSSFKSLINSLKRSEDPIVYYVETSAWQDANFKKQTLLSQQSPMGFVINDHIEHPKGEGSLVWEVADNRRPAQFILQAALSYPAEIAKSLHREEFRDFKELSIKNYKENINKGTEKIKEIASKLPSKLKLVKEREEIINSLTKCLNLLMHYHQLSDANHIIELLQVIAPSDRNALAALITAEEVTPMDVVMLERIWNLQLKEPDTIQIVHLGYVHTAWLEKKLKMLGCIATPPYHQVSLHDALKNPKELGTTILGHIASLSLQ